MPTKARASILRRGAVRRRSKGYGVCLPVTEPFEAEPDVTTEAYALDQLTVNRRKARDFLLPLLRRNGWRTVLDVGCGMGTMVAALLEEGYDAYGVDLPGLVRRWSSQGLPRDRFFVIGTKRLDLPFEDDSLDLAFALGVIEHIGTTDGRTDRAPDYQARRRQWLGELFRVVRPGGAVLVAGPNKGFPIDVAHGPDSRASLAEMALSRLAGCSVHKTWGRHFLLSYGDVRACLAGFEYDLEALSVRDLLFLGRVPRLLKPAAGLFMKGLPRVLLATGFNPWMAALIRKGRRGGPGAEGRQVLVYGPLARRTIHYRRR